MQTHKCSRCEKTRPIGDFLKNGKRPDGTPRPRSICKPCGSGMATSNTKPKVCPICKTLKPASAYPRNGVGTYCAPCHAQKYAYYRLPGGAGHQKHIERQTAYHKKMLGDDEYRVKLKARSSVRVAVVAGLLVKPTKCSMCRERKRITAHHHNGYEKKHWLDVEWLCYACHRKAEKNE